MGQLGQVPSMGQLGQIPSMGQFPSLGQLGQGPPPMGQLGHLGSVPSFGQLGQVPTMSCGPGSGQIGELTRANLGRMTGQGLGEVPSVMSDGSLSSSPGRLGTSGAFSNTDVSVSSFSIFLNNNIL